MCPIGKLLSGLPVATGVGLFGPVGLRHRLALHVVYSDSSVPSGLSQAGRIPSSIPTDRYSGRALH